MVCHEKNLSTKGHCYPAESLPKGIRVRLILPMVLVIHVVHIVLTEVLSAREPLLIYKSLSAPTFQEACEFKCRLLFADSLRRLNSHMVCLRKKAESCYK